MQIIENIQWSIWFPNFKSILRGTLVMIVYLINLTSAIYTIYDTGYDNDSIVAKTLGMVLLVCIYQIPVFTLLHWLWGIVLKLLHRKWYKNYRKGWFHLLEGFNACLVTSLVLPFTFVLSLLFAGFISLPSYRSIYSLSIYEQLISLVFIFIICLIASYYYYFGYLFWSWVNQKNNKLNQKYYDNKDFEKLKLTVEQKKQFQAKNKAWKLKTFEQSLRELEKQQSKRKN